ncbi:MAG TPA: class I SAM-dependent methyltransferase [Candidatus Kapabacteria bacterium]|jgi:SAM-dependent methyltransferase|nr:class I SAM-dependent methyltransferase [Candidatus Kapabacteria bacterium]
MLATERFSSRVENYVKYRPHYPDEVIAALRSMTTLKPRHIIADIGSGTGFSAELLLKNGNFVYGIEPNKEMREAGEHYLSTFKNFRSIDGTAEHTTLKDRSVDYILAGQAFHWFNNEETYQEFKRILKPNQAPFNGELGWLVILWNDRQVDTTPFLNDYEKLLKDFGTDYTEINHRNIDSLKVKEFFRGSEVIEMSFPNIQVLDYSGVEGRLLSSSYVPNSGEPDYDAMLARLREIFNKHQKHGTVDVIYSTLLYAGRL